MLTAAKQSWANEICSDDNEERAIVVGTTNDFAYVMGAWLPLLIWQQVDAPQYHKGFVSASCASGVGIALAVLVRILWHRDLAR